MRCKKARERDCRKVFVSTERRSQSAFRNKKPEFVDRRPGTGVWLPKNSLQGKVCPWAASPHMAESNYTLLLAGRPT